jgi:hypothetical protein
MQESSVALEPDPTGQSLLAYNPSSTPSDYIRVVNACMDTQVTTYIFYPFYLNLLKLCRNNKRLNRRGSLTWLQASLEFINIFNVDIT